MTKGSEVMRSIGLYASLSLKRIWNAPLLYKVRGRLFILSERIFGFHVERKRFKKKLGYELDIKNPLSFNQKMVWKKLFDRNELLPLTTDKLSVREYVRKVLGDELAQQILIPLLYAGDDPSKIPFDTLPEEYIIKANHDSGGFKIVRAGDAVDRTEISRRFRDMLSRPYGLLKHEWAYWRIQPRVLVEKLLVDREGKLAQDYKFHVFNGVCRFIHTTPKINAARSGMRCLFTPEWSLLPVGWKHTAGPMLKKPEHLEEMLKIAEKLGEDFDYVRVDLYNVDGTIYFGELTHYHGNGMERFYPESFDFEAGKWWKLPGKTN